MLGFMVSSQFLCPNIAHITDRPLKKNKAHRTYNVAFTGGLVAPWARGCGCRGGDPGRWNTLSSNVAVVIVFIFGHVDGKEWTSGLVFVTLRQKELPYRSLEAWPGGSGRDDIPGVMRKFFRLKLNTLVHASTMPASIVTLMGHCCGYLRRSTRASSENL
jgi:hypothetical protein